MFGVMQKHSCGGFVAFNAFSVLLDEIKKDFDDHA